MNRLSENSEVGRSCCTSNYKSVFPLWNCQKTWHFNNYVLLSNHDRKHTSAPDSSVISIPRHSGLGTIHDQV